MNNNNKLIYYFTKRYNHLLNDYTHILSTHLNNDKEMNDINSALIYHKINQYIQCNIIKILKSFGNKLCKYGIKDESFILITYIINYNKMLL